jgi:hypothetical protein
MGGPAPSSHLEVLGKDACLQGGIVDADGAPADLHPIQHQVIMQRSYLWRPPLCAGVRMCACVCVCVWRCAWRVVGAGRTCRGSVASRGRSSGCGAVKGWWVAARRPAPSSGENKGKSTIHQNSYGAPVDGSSPAPTSQPGPRAQASVGPAAIDKGTMDAATCTPRRPRVDLHLHATPLLRQEAPLSCQARAGVVYTLCLCVRTRAYRGRRGRCPGSGAVGPPACSRAAPQHAHCLQRKHRGDTCIRVYAHMRACICMCVCLCEPPPPCSSIGRRTLTVGVLCMQTTASSASDQSGHSVRTCGSAAASVWGASVQRPEASPPLTGLSVSSLPARNTTTYAVPPPISDTATACVCLCLYLCVCECASLCVYMCI